MLLNPRIYLVKPCRISKSQVLILEDSQCLARGNRKSCHRTVEMTQPGKELAAKTDNLRSIPGTHVLKEENPFPQLFSDLHTWGPPPGLKKGMGNRSKPKQGKSCCSRLPGHTTASKHMRETVSKERELILACSFWGLCLVIGWLYCSGLVLRKNITAQGPGGVGLLTSSCFRSRGSRRRLETEFVLPGHP